MTEEYGSQLRESWDSNADAWTRAVRGRGIPSRTAGTDAAIVAACTMALADIAPRERHPQRVLDVGCGEGWLARALASPDVEVLGVDGSEALIAAAHDGIPPNARFEVLSYEQLVDDATSAPGPFALAVCNFALLGDPVTPLLAALSRRLGADGRLVIQTVHPWTAAGDGAYRDEWREETFASFQEAFPAPMPWFARTLGSWIASVRSAGLQLLTVEEPVHPESGRPLSLLLVCGRAV